ncbi:MAG: hypothetical protein U1E97_03405 [Alphaproteobacteria bacterium]
MTTASTLADQERSAAAGGAKPARAATDATNDGGAASRRDLVAMHNSLLRAIQGATQADRAGGPDAGMDAAIGRLQSRLAEMGEAIMRMESLLAVNLRGEVQKAVREVAGPEVVVQAALRPKRLFRLLMLSVFVNLLLGIGFLVLAFPEFGHWVEFEIVPSFPTMLELRSLLATKL